jgi:hypothetical protein
MRQRVEAPRWTHSDGRPYDELDLGFARFVDEADLERSRPRPMRLLGSALALLRRARFRPRTGTDT